MPKEPEVSVVGLLEFLTAMARNKGAKTVLANPALPLVFEKLSANAGEIGGDQGTIKEIMDIPIENNVPYPGTVEHELPKLKKASSIDKCINWSMKEAQISAIEAYRSQNPAARARKLLENKGDNPEAYNILALYTSESYEEALHYYKKAVKCAPGVLLSRTRFNNICKSGLCWDHACLRPYIRALHGVALTYRKMGLYAEAEQAYKHLASVDTECHLDGYVNWRYHFLEVLLKQKKDDEAWELAHDKNMASCFGLLSTQCAWYWTLALLHYRRGVQRGFDYKFYDSKEEIGKSLKAPMLMAVFINHHVLDFLRGRRKVPAVCMPYAYVEENGLVVAALYASSNKCFWDETPGAVDWAIKNANTYKCLEIINENPPVYERLGLNSSYPFFKDLVTDGIYPNAMVDSSGLRLIHQVVLKCPRKLHLLLRSGADPNSTPKGMRHYTPLYAMASEDGAPMAAKYLVKFGGDPFVEMYNKGKRLMPIEEALVLGHARIVYAMLKFSTSLRFHLFDDLLCRLFQSETYDCVTPGIQEKCYKCRCKCGCSFKHSQNVNFEDCITALLSTGYKPSQKTVESLRKFKPNKRKSLMKTLEDQMEKSDEDLRVSLDNKYENFFYHCQRCHATGLLQKCASCRQVRYCSRPCQKKDWKSHKPNCKLQEKRKT